MKSRFVTVALLVGFLATSNAAGAKLTGEAAVQANVKNAAARFFRDNPRAASLSIGVYENGKTYRYNFGNLERGRRGAPTADSIYAIASITKTFTGTLLAQAAIEGKVKLDDDIRNYLDGNYPNLAFDGHPIRLFDLVDHRSGLPFILPDLPELQPDYHDRSTPWSARLARAEQAYGRQSFFDDLHKVKLTAIPGQTVGYSNAGATLAGYILERVYGLPFETLLRNKILDPLGMSNTAITLNRSQKALAAKGYDGAGTVMPEPPVAMQGAAALRSSVNDMLKYLAWEIAEQSQAVRLSHHPVVIVGTDITHLKWPYATGLNWQEILASGGTAPRRLIWQSGNIDGYHSLFIMEPELKIGLVVLSNETDDTSNAVTETMANAILAALDARAVTLP